MAAEAPAPSWPPDYVCQAVVHADPVAGRDLLPVCSHLASLGGWRKWTRADVMPLVALLAGRIAGVDGRSPEDRPGAQAYMAIMHDWGEYGEHNPWVMPLVDPLYVVADPATGQGAPGALAPPNLPLPCPPPAAVPPLPPLVPSGLSGTTWCFPGGAADIKAAYHFVGHLQAANPGLRVSIYHTGNRPAVLF